ncbi:MAG: hypothetical protein WCO09_00650, partial [bacterium]
MKKALSAIMLTAMIASITVSWADTSGTPPTTGTSSNTTTTRERPEDKKPNQDNPEIKALKDKCKADVTAAADADKAAVRTACEAAVKAKQAELNTGKKEDKKPAQDGTGKKPEDKKPNQDNPEIKALKD